MSSSRSFERTMTKSSPQCVTIPAQFVRELGDCFHAVVQVKMACAMRLWWVKVNVYFMKNQPHVSFGAGWKDFMRGNRIFEGETVKFTLTRTSLFEVSRVRKTASTIARIVTQEGPATRRSSELQRVLFDDADEGQYHRHRHSAPVSDDDIMEVVVIEG